MKPLVIYHADCTDGFGAAFAAWLKLGNDAEYLPMQYNVDFCDPVGQREVYILDFSFPRETMHHLFATAKRVVWLDHHKTAFEMWCGEYHKGKHYMAIRECARDCHVNLDDNKSGALLAWEYFHPGAEAPVLIQHIDDRDRWQFKLEGSRELHAALQSYKPWSFEQWKVLLNDWDLLHRDDLMLEGLAILRAQEQNIASILKQARRCRIPNLNVSDLLVQDRMLQWEIPHNQALAEVAEEHPFTGLALNAPIHQSEIGHELANASDTFGLVWYLSADNRAKCSLRSNGDYDVSAIARAFGGGGHRNAAGFEIDIQTLMEWLK